MKGIKTSKKLEADSLETQTNSSAGLGTLSMRDAILQAKLAKMQERYLNSAGSQTAMEQVSSRKMAKIKKKLANLEIERCQRNFGHSSCQEIDRKIEKQKERYASYCTKD
ncbi:hypothetical protein [Streptococcus dentiloxodontae]